MLAVYVLIAVIAVLVVYFLFLRKSGTETPAVTPPPPGPKLERKPADKRSQPPAGAEPVKSGTAPSTTATSPEPSPPPPPARKGRESVPAPRAAEVAPVAPVPGE